jgi:hypothetical protein
MGMIPADAQAFNGDNREIVGNHLGNFQGARPQGIDNIKTKGNSAWQCFPTST